MNQRNASAGGASATISQRKFFAIWTLAWSPDGQYIASASADKTVQIWDVATGKLLSTYSGHTDVVWAVAWSPDGKRLASAGHDKQVQVWEPL